MNASRNETGEVLLLRPEEAARVLRVGRSKLYSLVARGELPVIRVGARGVRIPAGALNEWIAAHIQNRVNDAG